MLKRMRNFEESGDEEKKDDPQPQEGQQQSNGDIPKQQTINVRGQQREYYYVKTVKSMDELEQFRFSVMQEIKYLKLI